MIGKFRKARKTVKKVSRARKTYAHYKRNKTAYFPAMTGSVGFTAGVSAHSFKVRKEQEKALENYLNTVFAGYNRG